MTANIGEPQTTAPTVPPGRIPADTFSVRLLLSRHLAGMTMKEAAERSGINDATWATWESGRRPRDVVEVCQRVAHALDINFNWLLLGGPLLGPRGLPTKRVGNDTDWYSAVAPRSLHNTVRPGDSRPKVRKDQPPAMSARFAGRRPARIG